MKKTLLLALAIILSIATQAKTIEKTYFYTDFQLQQNGDYYLIQAPGALNTAITGQALLPWYAAKLLLPPGEIIESVEFIGQNLVKIPGSFQLMPKQYVQPISKGGSGIFAKDEAFYNSNDAYPKENITNGGSNFWAGHSIGFVNYTPFIYQAKSGIISYYSQVTIIVKTKPSAKAEAAKSLSNRQKNIQSQISSYIDNPEALNDYPSQITKSDDYDYLIITPEQFVAEFDTLIKHYLVRGLKTIVKSKEDILSEMTGQDAPEKIRNYIIQEYSAHAISYVMLGGDVEHIPYRGFFCSVQSSSVYEDDNIPSDLYYSALDGSWNDDGDNKWAEIGEDDLLPEVAVARFSFSNSAELSKMLNKTISYQTTPVIGNLGHPLMVGEHLYDDPLTYGSDYLEMVIGYKDENGYETTGIPEDNNFTKLYASEANWTSSQLTSEINQGKNFLHHCGHANTSTVMNYHTSDITNSNFANANGVDAQFTNIYTHGCICGAFDANDCIAEHMVKIDNFAAAFIGNSRYGWFNEGQTEGPSGHIHREFVDALYTDSLHRIGMAHMESKYATAPWVTAAGQWEEGAIRWCFYDCNVLGDPAMSVWTAEPWDITVNYPSAVTIGQNTLEVVINSNGNPVNGLTAALVKDGILYGTALSNSNGICQISLDPVFTAPGIAKLYVSGFNCVPHEYDVQIIPAEGAYIVFNGYSIDDATGNNNQLLDYNETVDLNISLENVGSENAASVTADITCDNPNITINSSNAAFGDINGNASQTLDAAFNITLSDDVEDLTAIEFLMTINSGSEEWETTFNISAHAPKLETLGFSLNDETGNSNGVLDPGETVLMTINFANNGSSLSQDITAVLSNSSSFITITNGNQNTTGLNPEEQTNLEFEIIVSETAELGDIAQLNFDLTSGSYNAFMSYQLTIGLQIEDWETSDFSQYSWTFGGNADWSISTNDSYEGENCAQSGNITDNQSSDMILSSNIINTDSISFYFKVSSEANYDFLHFYIDEQEQDKWAGDQGWTRRAYLVNSGEHIFKWSYTKDGNTSSGSDMAGVDYIVFPSMGILSQTQNISNASLALNLYPNPVRQTAQLSFNNDKEQALSVQIINQNGQLVLFSKSEMLSKGHQNMSFDLSGLAKGTYTIILKGKNTLSSITFIKM